MKKISALLVVPLIVMVALGLTAGGCGSAGSGSTTLTSSPTGSTSASQASPSGTTAATMTTTTNGSATGVPSTIAVQLVGDQEVPLVNTSATGTFTLTISTGTEAGESGSSLVATTSSGLLPAGLRVSYRLEVKDITDATAAHIHLGAKGQNGDVIYALFTGPQKSGDFSGILAEGPLTEGDFTGPYKGKTFADLVAAVLEGDTYVNVHTAENPNGEIRGQIIIDMGAGSTSTSAGGAGVGTSTSGVPPSTTQSGGY